MTEQDKEQLNIEISHIFESGANHLRIFEMVENFIDKRYKAINYTHCCKSDSELLPKRLSNRAYNNAKTMRYEDFVKWWDEQV